VLSAVWVSVAAAEWPVAVSALGIKIQNASRTTLEWAIRQRVLAYHRVELHAGFVVDALELDRASGTVTGVAGPQRDIASSPGPTREPGPRRLRCRRPRPGRELSGWLAEIGWEHPEIFEVDGRISYVSRFFRFSTDHAVDWYMAARGPTPPRSTLVAAPSCWMVAAG
jgi:hypothetical protein